MKAPPLVEGSEPERTSAEFGPTIDLGIALRTCYAENLAKTGA
jgi:hypothetical protein